MYRLCLDMEVTAISCAVLHRYIAICDPAEFFAMSADDIKLLVSTSLFLASKLEERPRRLRDVINVTHRLTYQK